MKVIRSESPTLPKRNTWAVGLRVAAFAVCTLVGGAAFGAEPIVKERKGASRLQPKSGSFDALEKRQGFVPLATAKQHDWEPHVGGHARFVSMPGSILGIFFQSYQSFAHASAGLSVDFGNPRDELISVELDWTGMTFSDANWLEKGAPLDDAKFTQIGLHMISLDVTYRDIVHLVDALDFTYGAGLGLAGLIGPAVTTEVLPTCSEPISKCQHWRNVSRSDLDFPTRVIPVLHVTAGLQLELEGVRTRLDLGFKNVFYVGLSAGFTL